MIRNKTTAAIVVAAGTGTRAAADGADVPKQYRPVKGVPMLSRTIRALLDIEEIQWVVPVIHPDHTRLFAALGFDEDRVLPPATGGASRQASVLVGLQALGRLKPDLVLIQDAARPFLDSALVSRVLDALETSEGAVPVMPVTDTIKRSADGQVVQRTEDRTTLYAAQTPQGFRFEQILSAHMRAARLPRDFTDDAEVAEWAGMSVALTPGSARNIKITHPDDFERAERILGGMTMESRVGTGFDVHPFGPGDHIWLGGIRIPHNARLVGHSDADAALHALTDAIYGALGEGDIGSHFPPSDPRWKGEPSATFLEHAAGLVAGRGGRVVSLDVTIVCEAPKIGPHIAAMKERIAEICRTSPTRVAIKATTAEQLGFIGRGEGLVAMATASLEVPREDH